MPDPYALTSESHRPALTGTVAVRPDPESIIDALAADLTIHAQNCVRTFGDFQLALSGGSTPAPLYRRLMIDPAFRQFPWGRTHLWIVDERRVPFDDDRSNFKLIGETIADNSGIPAEQVHPIFALADDADERYSATLREVLGWRPKGHDRLDFVLLGMGSDGHTASLFPRSPALRESLLLPEAPGAGPIHRSPSDVPLVRINAGPTVVPPERVTMMLPLINASRFVAVLVSGRGKRETVRRVVDAAAREYSPAEAYELPILGVRPLAGELRWFLDQEACPVPSS